MTSEQISTVTQVISGVIIAVSSGLSGIYYQKRKQPKQDDINENKCTVENQLMCPDHKDVIVYVKQIPLVVSSLKYLEKRFDSFEIDMKESFRILRSHEGSIENLKGSSSVKTVQ